MTADVLIFYSIGLFAYGSTKITQSCFFALKDTSTPAKVSFLALCMNVILNSVLMFPMKLAGIALATSISGIISFLVLFFILKDKLKPFVITPIVFSFVRIVAASLLMGIVCYFASRRICILETGILVRLLKLSLFISLGIVSYVIFCFIFRVREMQEAWAWFVRRRSI